MLDLVLPVDRHTGRIAAQVTAAIREAIRAGRLPPGSRLPSTRVLAADLGVSRGVVVEAYEQLAAEGYLVTRQGAATRVAPDLAAAPPPAVPPPTPDGAEALPYDLRWPIPDLADFPRSRWLTATRQALLSLPHAELGYADPGGVPALRAELAAYLRRVAAAACRPEQVTAVSGVAQGLAVALRVLARRGHSVLAVEDPSTHRIRPLLRECGYELVGIPVDAEGIDVAALDASRATVALVTPAHQFPTGVVLSARRRADLVDWARRREGYVIEDSYDAEFRYDREPVGCLQGLAPDRVFLTGSVSKTLAPALRLGWLVAPEPYAAEVGTPGVRLDLGVPTLNQHALAHLLASGGYDRHLRAARRRYRARRDALVRALRSHLPAWRVHGVAAGLQLYVELPSSLDDVEVARRAYSAGVGVQPVPPCGSTTPARPRSFWRTPRSPSPGSPKPSAGWPPPWRDDAVCCRDRLASSRSRGKITENA